MNDMYVVCPACSKHLHTEEDYIFKDIEEDILGQDLMTFVCRFCGKVGQSLVHIQSGIQE